MQIAATRRVILSFFHASHTEYDVVFTSGATSALKLVGEMFFTQPTHPKKRDFVTLRESCHNSALGIREFPQNNWSVVAASELEEKIGACEAEKSSEILSEEEGKNDGDVGLFSFPAECNFSGVRFPWERWVSAVQRGVIDPRKFVFHAIFPSPSISYFLRKWYVLLDAAKHCAEHPLDLSLVYPDFVVVTFYKMMGYPTGIGALLVRKSSAHVLTKSYFGGGTVAASSATSMFRQLRQEVKIL